MCSLCGSRQAAANAALAEEATMHVTDHYGEIPDRWCKWVTYIHSRDCNP
jgi:hypothetical protein